MVFEVQQTSISSSRLLIHYVTLDKLMNLSELASFSIIWGQQVPPRRLLWERNEAATPAKLEDPHLHCYPDWHFVAGDGQGPSWQLKPPGAKHSPSAAGWAMPGPTTCGLPRSVLLHPSFSSCVKCYSIPSCPTLSHDCNSEGVLSDKVQEGRKQHPQGLIRLDHGPVYGPGCQPSSVYIWHGPSCLVFHSSPRNSSSAKALISIFSCSFFFLLSLYL